MVSVGLAQLPVGLGLPPGGNSGQVLVKPSADLRALGWDTVTGAPQPMPIISTYWYDNRTYPALIAGLSITVNTSYFVAVYNPVAFNMSAAGIVSQSTSPATTAQFALYVNSASNTPGTLLATSSVVNVNGTGGASGALVATMPAGFCWLSVVNGSASITIDAFNSAAGTYPILHYGNGATPSGNVPSSPVWYTSTGSPASNPTVTAQTGNFPYIGYRAA